MKILPPMRPAKKLLVKTAKARCKIRKDTPAPPTKGDGRKRLDLSPFPEDKQLRKKIDFGDKESPTLEAPKCRGNIFPANIQVAEGSSKNMEHEAEIAPIERNLEMGMVCFKPPNADEVSPASGDRAGDEEGVGHEEDNRLHQPWSKLADPSNENGVVVGDNVNFPKMNLETKVLLESPLEPNPLEESHGALAVGHHLKPKNDTILSIAHLESADMFDSMVAQPLLAGGLPENAHLAGDQDMNSLMVLDAPLMALATPSPNPKEPDEASDPQPCYSDDRLVNGNMAVKPLHIHMQPPSSATPEPCAITRGVPTPRKRKDLEDS